MEVVVSLYSSGLILDPAVEGGVWKKHVALKFLAREMLENVDGDFHKRMFLALNFNKSFH